jgi:hypothetical protein
LLVNPLGPVQLHVATPGVDVDADNCNVEPLQMGDMLAMVGVAGGVGSTIVKGPTVLELQPFKETEIPE